MPGKAEYGGMDVSKAQEAKQLRDENTKLRKLVADEFGEGSAAVGDSTKRLELAVLKVAVEQLREEYASGQQRACGLMTMGGIELPLPEHANREIVALFLIPESLFSI